jgi:hypothetical protein
MAEGLRHLQTESNTVGNTVRVPRTVKGLTNGKMVPFMSVILLKVLSMVMENGKKMLMQSSQILMKASISMIRNVVRVSIAGHLEMSTEASLRMTKGMVKAA